MGIAGEKKFQYQNFKKLYSVFETVSEFTIKYNNKEIGTLQAWFVFSMGNNLSFYLAGNSWSVIDIDEENKVIFVEQSEKASLPSWSGTPLVLTYELCQQYLKIISKETLIDDLGPREMEILQDMQGDETKSGYTSETIVIEETEKNICIYTFAGNKVNYTLALMLKYSLDFEKFDVTGFQIDLPVHLKVNEIIKNLEKFKANNNYYFSNAFINRYIKSFPEIKYSKFQEFVPLELSQEYLSDLLLDIEKTKYICNTFAVTIQPLSESGFTKLKKLVE